MSRKKKSRIGQSAPNVAEVQSKKSILLEDDSNPVLSANGSPEDSGDQDRDTDQKQDVEAVKEITDDELRKELKRFLIPKLRSASYRWTERSKAIKNARIERGVYECAHCKARMKNGEFKADHKNPVVALDGWAGDWDTYINRMFVRADGFQILCSPCHEIKSDAEVQIRKMHRQKKKDNENN